MDAAGPARVAHVRPGVLVEAGSVLEAFLLDIEHHALVGGVEVQRLLLKRGHAIGTPDGVLGTASRAAIQQEQQRLGMTVDGRAGQKLLKALRDGR